MKKKIVLPDLKQKMVNNRQGVYLIKNYITNNNIEIGDYTYYHCQTENEAKSFQNQNILYHFPFCNDEIVIGKFCSLAYKVKFIMNGANHNYQLLSTYPMLFLFPQQDYQKLFAQKNKGNIEIGHDVWIGYDATILPGVKIGNGAIVGAKAVVSKDVPAYAIVVGNPARIVKYRFSQATIEKIEQLQWWNWTEEEFNKNWLLLTEKYS